MSPTVQFLETHDKNINIPVYFLGATIFFISVLIIYFSSQKDYGNVDSIFKISSYLSVFYEKRINGGQKPEEMFAWEIANFEMSAKWMTESENKQRKNIFKRKRIYVMNGEYAALAGIATIVILFIIAFSSNVLEQIHNKPAIDVALFLACVAYLFISLCLLRAIHKNATLKNSIERKTKYYNDFIKYALDTGYYSEKELEERFSEEFLKFLGRRQVA